jgi:hypothetical protein
MSELHREISQVELAKGSIYNRKEIRAPSNYVSVYHVTEPEFLPAIEEGGLRSGVVSKYMGKDQAVKYNKVNDILDEARPQYLRSLGISRRNLYALVGLKNGEWVSRSIKRFTEGIADQTADHREVLELKIDPEKCWVVDAEDYEYLCDRLTSPEIVKKFPSQYWEGAMLLKDFLKYYAVADFDKTGQQITDSDDFAEPEMISRYSGHYYKRKGAPAGLPDFYAKPEILIPEDVPQEHIRVM